MSINQGGNYSAYGIQNGVQPLAPPMIFAGRAPTVLDYAPQGTWWIDVLANSYYILTSKQHWTPQQSGSDTQATLILNGAAGTVLSVLTGDTVLGGDLNVGGELNVGGDLVVTDTTILEDTVTIYGSLNVGTSSTISLTSTLNAAPAILIATNGGPREAIVIVSNQGTGDTSILVSSSVGGVTLSAALNLTMNSSINTTINSGVTSIISTGNVAGCIELRANAGTSESIEIISNYGTSYNSILIQSQSGGIQLIGSEQISIETGSSGYSGNILIKSKHVSVASTTCTNNSFFGTCLYTGNVISGFGGTQTFYLLNSNITNVSAVMLNVSYDNTSGSNASVAITAQSQIPGALTFVVTNTSANTLLITDTVIVGFQVLL